MLPVARRVRRAEEFRSAVRGTRAGGALLVVHLATGTPDPADPADPADAADLADAAGPAGPPAPARAGFVVSRAVGSAVVRNRVRRRLRHLVAARLDDLPAGSLLVVRAQPAAAGASSAELAAAIDDGIRRVLRRSGATERERIRA